jgi:uncharacterized protein
MNCPLDGTELRMAERSGIEIDYCPQCRGIWLDRGELDKLIERNSQYDDDYREPSNNHHVPYQGERHPYEGKRKRGSPFDIFDIFD